MAVRAYTVTPNRTHNRLAPSRLVFQGSDLSILDVACDTPLSRTSSSTPPPTSRSDACRTCWAQHLFEVFPDPFRKMCRRDRFTALQYTKLGVVLLGAHGGLISSETQTAAMCCRSRRCCLLPLMLSDIALTVKAIISSSNGGRQEGEWRGMLRTDASDDLSHRPQSPSRGKRTPIFGASPFIRNVWFSGHSHRTSSCSVVVSPSWRAPVSRSACLS